MRRQSTRLSVLIGLLVGVGAGLPSACNRCLAAEHAEDVLLPQIDGDWWQVAGDPDLGEYTDPGQQPVDFGVWQAGDGTWQLWSCIRKTRCGGNTRLFYRWQGEKLTDKDWKPMGIAMTADPKYGEAVGGLQAPHVIRVGDRWMMFYGDWSHICSAESRDGTTFERVLNADGRPQLFTEDVEVRANTRDPMVLPVGDTYYCYYTAYPHGKGAVYCRTSKDLKRWSDSKIVAFGGRAGSNPYSAECPHVIHRHGYYYLFRTQRYGRNAQTSVYRSKDPMDFGVNDDRRFVCTLPVAAPEIVAHGGRDYLASLLPSLKGIRIARLKWVPRDEWVPRGVSLGRSLFDFSDAEVRDGWKLVEGNIDPIFTTSNRQFFRPAYRHFIGTAESRRLPGKPDDAQVGVIESPPFRLEAPRYALLVSGGSDRERTCVAVVEAQSGEELANVTGAGDSNLLEPIAVDLVQYRGRKVRIRVVDRAAGGWGHVNFGGMFVAEGKPPSE